MKNLQATSHPVSRPADRVGIMPPAVCRWDARAGGLIRIDMRAPMQPMGDRNVYRIHYNFQLLSMARVALESAAMRMMTLSKHGILAAVLLCSCMIAAQGEKAPGQSAPCAPRLQTAQMHESPAKAAAANPDSPPLESPYPTLTVAPVDVPCASRPLFDITDSDVKFRLASLMTTLRDPTHESWVLAAYPDPKTSRPLIGAGFSLDVPASEHLQSDALNPYTFLEPSSAELWEAAGLDPARLQTILGQYDRELKKWKKKNFRKKIKTHQLPPQLTDADATKLLQISAVQAVHNARAYCREFDQLSASQQMALSELVYQMGVNLEEFIQFLATLNDLSYHDPVSTGENRETEAEHWKAVQNTLIDSDWARRYSTRAVAVIAMFDPQYEADPAAAERLVRAQVHPLVVHHRKKSHGSTVRAGNDASRKTQQRGATESSTGKS